MMNLFDSHCHLEDERFQGEVEQYHIGCTIGVHTGPTPIGIAVIRKYDA